MNPTTVDELREIVKEIDLIALDREIAQEFLRGDHDEKMSYIDDMTPELREAITDVNAFRCYLDNFKNFGPNTAELQLWIDHQVRTKGLVDFKFTLMGDRSKMTVESVAGELLALIRAPKCEDRELI